MGLASRRKASIERYAKPGSRRSSVLPQNCLPRKGVIRKWPRGRVILKPFGAAQVFDRPRIILETPASHQVQFSPAKSLETVGIHHRRRAMRVDLFRVNDQQRLALTAGIADRSICASNAPRRQGAWSRSSTATDSRYGNCSETFKASSTCRISVGESWPIVRSTLACGRV